MLAGGGLEPTSALAVAPATGAQDCESAGVVGGGAEGRAARPLAQLARVAVGSTPVLTTSGGAWLVRRFRRGNRWCSRRKRSLLARCCWKKRPAQ